jgi:hypothetical protein
LTDIFPFFFVHSDGTLVNASSFRASRSGVKVLMYPTAIASTKTEWGRTLFIASQDVSLNYGCCVTALFEKQAETTACFQVMTGSYFSTSAVSSQIVIQGDTTFVYFFYSGKFRQNSGFLSRFALTGENGPLLTFDAAWVVPSSLFSQPQNALIEPLKPGFVTALSVDGTTLSPVLISVDLASTPSSSLGLKVKPFDGAYCDFFAAAAGDCNCVIDLSSLSLSSILAPEMKCVKN